MYAIIRDRGKQYKVSEGEIVELDLLNGVQAGDALEFKEILLTSDGSGNVQVGEPTVPSATVSGKVVTAVHKGNKIDVVHFRRRKDSMKKRGHRQRYTHVKVESIQTGTSG